MSNLGGFWKGGPGGGHGMTENKSVGWLRWQLIIMRTARMGAGFAVGTERTPLMQFSAPVGWPFSSLRAEAASLLHFLRRVQERFPDQRDLLIFIDCLVLHEMGEVGIPATAPWHNALWCPRPSQSAYGAALVARNSAVNKYQSHACCLLNERSDALAEMGVT